MREAARIKTLVAAAPLAGVTRQKVGEWEDGVGMLEPLVYAVRLARQSPEARELLLGHVGAEGASQDHDVARIAALLRTLKDGPEWAGLLRGLEQIIEAFTRMVR